MMKKFIFGVIGMGLVSATAVVSAFNQELEQVNQDIVEQMKIENTVYQVGSLADANRFDALEQLYAPEVLVDYESLSGEEPTLKSNTQLMTEWAGVLPGFDVTQHQISNVVVNVNGYRAHVQAQVIADHYVDDLFWQVKGNYHYTLVKDAQDWKIAKHRFVLREEKGTRDVFAPAIQNARSKPNRYLIKAQSKQTVVDFLEALENKDMDKFANVWAEDAVQDMPFSPEGFPKRVVGKQNLLSHYKAWPEISCENSDFTRNLVFYDMLDPETVLVEYDGSVDILSTGKHYQQRYAGLFHVIDGKIELFREYYDPIIFKEAFDL
ncbi:nuclear transport factor 2 family protein [Glaciecola siphonariae]|uniref:Nuclear transport factor 2 family protein n=1 Tax=Glaciecola siphonariae TaxID=521012 RepID=A0ABV9LVY8_9ALTE